MKLACKTCHNLYDERKQSMICPHKEFPIECELHKRKHCGMPDCAESGKILDFNARRISNGKQ
jgi:hypothetical protein